MMQFLDGVLFMGYGVIALFFVRYWRRSGDRIFVFFAISFALMSVHRALFAMLDVHDEVGTWIYWIRLLSYLLILYAILDRNLRQPKR